MALHIGVTAAEQSIAQGVDCYCRVSGPNKEQTATLRDFIRNHLASSRFALLESLAGHLANSLMLTFDLAGVAIRLTKHPYDMTDITGAGVLFSMGDHPIDPNEGVPAPWSHVFLRGLRAQHTSSHCFSIHLAFFVDVLSILTTDDITCTVDYAKLTQDIRCFMQTLPAETSKHIDRDLTHYLKSILAERAIAVCQATPIAPKHMP